MSKKQCNTFHLNAKRMNLEVIVIGYFIFAGCHFIVYFFLKKIKILLPLKNVMKDMQFLFLQQVVLQGWIIIFFEFVTASFCSSDVAGFLKILSAIVLSYSIALFELMMICNGFVIYLIVFRPLKNTIGLTQVISQVVTQSKLTNLGCHN